MRGSCKGVDPVKVVSRHIGTIVRMHPFNVKRPICFGDHGIGKFHVPVHKQNPWRCLRQCLACGEWTRDHGPMTGPGTAAECR